MKRIKLLYAIIFFVMFTLLSCKNDLTYLDGENPNTEKSNNGNFEYTDSDDKPVEYQNLVISTPIKYADGYLYYHDGISFVRYNPSTNNKTYLCGDPICSHTDPTCPLYTISAKDCVYVYDNKIYFKQKYAYDNSGKLENVDREVAYDIKTGKLTVLRNNNEDVKYGVTNRLYYENLVYYYEYTLKDINVINNISNISDYYVALFKQDLNTGKITELEKFDDGIYDYPIAGVNGKIYFAAPSDGIFYINAADTDRKEKNYIYNGRLNFDTDMMACDGEYIYYLIRDTSNSKTTYCRMNMADGATENLLTTDAFAGDYLFSDCFYLTENYIYYSRRDSKIIGQLPSQAGILSDCIIHPSKIYRMKHDGSENTLIFSDFPTGMETYSLSGYFIVAGNYIYSEYTHYGELKDTYELSDLHYDPNEIIRIDINTKEIFYIK